MKASAKGKLPMLLTLILVLSGLVIACIGLALSDWKEDRTPRTPEQIQADIADIHGVSLAALKPCTAEREAEEIVERIWRSEVGE